jgi:hypothetical protein
VTGSHSVKVGFTLMHAWRYNTQEPNNSVTLQVRGTQPFSLRQYATPVQFHETLRYNAGFFAQDQWRISRLTVNYGVRLDMLNARVDPQDFVGGPFTPAHSFEGVENAPNWRDVDPRLGVAWDIFGDGKTAFKASVGRYVVGESYTIARAVNPMSSFAFFTDRTWTTPAGVPYVGTYNPYDDCDLTNPAANTKRPGRIQCGPVQNPAFGQLTTRTTNYDPGVINGWHVRPNNWEGQVSIQREIVPRVSAYAAYTRRSFGNLTATRNQAVTNADFSPYCVPVPADSRLENGGNYQQCGLFDVNRNITPNNLIFNSSDIGGIEDVYDGFDFDVNARLARNIILSGGVTFGRERISYCNLKDDLSLTTTGFGVNTPRTDDYCNIAPPFQPQVKGQVAYPLPWWDVSLSATFQSLSGPQLNANYPLTNALVAPSLGRNFTGVPPTVNLLPNGSMYGDRIYQTDLRVSKAFRSGGTVIRPTVSIYNLFNANPIQTYNVNYGSAWLSPTVIMQARFVDIGVQVDF